jgi:uncharacterized protein involved in tellurium resistance
MEFFLGLDSCNGVDDGLSLLCTLELVSRYIVRHVGEKFGEERDFPQLVEGNETE